VVVGSAWGVGGSWLLDALPGMLGEGDGAERFAPRHRVVHEARRRYPRLRLGRTGLVMESLVPAVLEQKVTVIEAHRAWRRLLLEFGTAAPGPAPEGMRCPPTAREWLRVPSWEWHRAGVDAKRAATVVRAARVAGRLEETIRLRPEEAAERMCAVPGIGVWTAAETVQRSHGAADAVSVGDLHLARAVGWALTGEREADDARMLELLSPYSVEGEGGDAGGGQRHRACRFIKLGPVARRARREPRREIRDFRAM
jgi:3-methyladenine DNA glycosylase/8-oxoguanine DNA glycosylase